MLLKRVSLLLLLLVLAACAAVLHQNFDALYGKPSYEPRVTAELAPGQVDYWQQVQPVLDKRCVICHGCYDAPCQLKLSAIEGIERGATEQQVYHASRLKAATPTRLFEDGDTIEQWRQMDFHSVLSEYPELPDSYRNASVLYRMLELKEQHPLPESDLLPEDFTLGLKREQVCTDAQSFEAYAVEHPLWGMPYGMPGLPEREQAVIKQWLDQGAQYTAREPLPAEYQPYIERWEALLNQNSLKTGLVSRYLYEHLFFAQLYFSELDSDAPGAPLPRYFRLVRSATPPGEPVQRISTRRPYDDPGVARVYYRLVPDPETVVVKTHMPYALSPARMASWQALFWRGDYQVSELPGYEVEVAANPFASFSQLPVRSRYQFMLEDAHFFIQGFIKGPVCRGQVALNVIRDHFWVFFVRPDHDKHQTFARFLETHSQSLELPNVEGDNLTELRHWRAFAKRQREYLASLDELLSKTLDPKKDVSLDILWDGEGRNPNAALTVFRHFDTATVSQGLVGGEPHTAWLVDYPLLERIHYLLVAGYDVFGSLSHQLQSRLYMDFLRMEGETMFLQLLPPSVREQERLAWYEDADDELLEYLSLPQFEQRALPAIDYRTPNPKQELFSLLQQKLAPVLSDERTLARTDDPHIRQQLERLAALGGEGTAVLPEMMVIAVEESGGGMRYFSLLHNRARSTMTSMRKEEQSLAPERFTVSVLRGVSGAHPVSMMRVGRAELAEFVDQLYQLTDEQSYRELVDRFGVRRNYPQFWPFLDALHEGLSPQPLYERGILDFNRLENR